VANIVYDFSNTFLNRNKDPNVNDITYRDINIIKLTDRIITKNKNKIDEFDYHQISDSNTSRLDKEAVNNALTNLMTFKPGDYILQPDFGNILYQYLYEPINGYMAEKISYTLRKMIYDWEPRISILDIKIAPDMDNNSYEIRVYYTIPTLLGNQEVNTFDYSLQNNITLY